LLDCSRIINFFRIGDVEYIVYELELGVPDCMNLVKIEAYADHGISVSRGKIDRNKLIWLPEKTDFLLKFLKYPWSKIIKDLINFHELGSSIVESFLATYFSPSKSQISIYAGLLFEQWVYAIVSSISKDISIKKFSREIINNVNPFDNIGRSIYCVPDIIIDSGGRRAAIEVKINFHPTYISQIKRYLGMNLNNIILITLFPLKPSIRNVLRRMNIVVIDGVIRDLSPDKLREKIKNALSMLYYR